MNYTLPTPTLVAMLKATLIVAKNADPLLPPLRAVQFTFNDSYTAAVATDRYRLVYVSTKDYPWDDTNRVTLPADSLEAVVKLIGMKGAEQFTTITVEDNGTVTFTNGEMATATHVVDGDAPKVASFVNEDPVVVNNDRVYAFNPGYLVDVGRIAKLLVRTVSTPMQIHLFSPNKPVTFTSPEESNKHGLTWKVVQMPVRLAR